MTNSFLSFVNAKRIASQYYRVREVHQLLQSTTGPKEIALGCTTLKWQVRILLRYYKIGNWKRFKDLKKKKNAACSE